MRKKSLNPTEGEQIWVNIGWKLTKGGKRSQAKIYLGDSLKDAERRLARLEQFWEDIEKNSAEPLWNEFTLAVAKGLAKGELQFVVERRSDEDTDDYAQRLNRLSLEYPSIKFVAGDEDAYEHGQDQMLDYAQVAFDNACDAFGLTGVVGLRSTGTLHQAMEAYIEWIKRDYFDIEEGHVNDNGMTKIKQVVALKEFSPRLALTLCGIRR